MDVERKRKKERKKERKKVIFTGMKRNSESHRHRIKKLKKKKEN